MKNGREKRKIIGAGRSFWTAVLCTAFFLPACASPEPTEQKPPRLTDAQGVEYLLSEKANEYTVVGVNTNETELVIPDSLENCPVTEIGKQAFLKQKKLVQITLGKNVERIGEAAFYGCETLKTLSLPSGLQTVDHYAFDECESLQYFEENGIFYLGNADNPFVYLSHTKGELESVTVGIGCAIIAPYAFQQQTKLQSAVLPEGVRRIGRQVFEDCRALCEIELPRSLSFLDSYVFARCAALPVLDYAGSKAEWGKMERIWDWRYECVINKVVCSDGIVYI